MFVDKTVITVQGGDGGNGCISFRREKYIPFGGPSGGDGGDGGSVLLVAAPGEQSLVEMYYTRNYRAESGEHGRGKDQYGKRGKDIELKVPAGTVVRDLDDGGKVLFEITEPGVRVVAAKGGHGGRGNIHFLSNDNKAPRICEEGIPGEKRRLELELKTIADVGLVGYPNAGKSTLLGAVSAAKPKIAPYPFTTLHPVVGTVEFPDFFRMSIADIPGLVDGAHQNIGLGHAFLRHIERTRVLVYVLDMAGVDGRKPWDDLVSLRKELDLYLDGLSTRPAVIAANKVDLPEAAENLEDLRSREPSIPICPISAAEELNLDELLQLLRNKITGRCP